MARIRAWIMQGWIIATLALALSSTEQAQQSPTDRAIATSQARAARSNAAADYDKLGAAYLQKGRETADASYYQLAEKALMKSLEMSPTMEMSAAAPLTHMAAACMAEHRFTDAADYASHALALGSGDLSPYSLLGDAHADMGDYDEAGRDYEKLLLHLSSPEPEPSLVYMRDTRVSYLRLIRGDDAGAIDLARRSVKTAMALHMPRENLAWTYYQLGEYLFQAGDLAGAEAAYQEAVNQLPGYYRGLSGLAKVRVAQQKYRDAIHLYSQAIEEVPFPDFIAALGDVYLKIGQPKEAQKQYDLVEYIGRLSELNQQTYNRELALFYADRGIKLPQSLELAQKELEVRRDVYTQDVLAWSLYKNGKLKEAASAMDKALSLGTKDPNFYFHAGMIHRDMGDVDASREYFERALVINPNFHVFYAGEARQALETMPAKTAKTERSGQ